MPRENEELVHRYLPLARTLAGRYRHARESHDDLVQVASLGLVLAAKRFDASRGNSFSSFAVPTILGELRRHLREHGWSLRVSRGLQEDALSITAARDELTGSLGRAPTPRELAKSIGRSVEAVFEAIVAGAAYEADSLDREYDAEESSPRFLCGADDPGYALVEYGVSIRPAWAELSEQEREVVHLRFIEDLTQADVAARIGVSQMQVSRLQRRALDQLRLAAGEELAEAA